MKHQLTSNQPKGPPNLHLIDLTMKIFIYRGWGTGGRFDGELHSGKNY